MTDPDLRRWLKFQTSASVGHVPLAVLRGSNAAGALKGIKAQVIFADAIDDEDIYRLGLLVRDARFVTIGSAIGAGLARALGKTERQGMKWTGSRGPAVLIAGSCSQAISAQIAAYDGLGNAGLRFVDGCLDLKAVRPSSVTLSVLVVRLRSRVLSSSRVMSFRFGRSICLSSARLKSSRAFVRLRH